MKKSELVCLAVAIMFSGVLSAVASIAAIPLPDKVKASDAILIAEVERLMTNRYVYVFNSTNQVAGEYEVPGDNSHTVIKRDVEDYLDLLHHLNRRRNRLGLPSTEDGFTPPNPLDGELYRFLPEVVAICRVLEAFKGDGIGELVRVVFRDPGPPRMTPWPRTLRVGHTYILWLTQTNQMFKMITPHQGVREVAPMYYEPGRYVDGQWDRRQITHEDHIARIKESIQTQNDSTEDSTPPAEGVPSVDK